MASAAIQENKVEYRYLSEIGQMMFVFADVEPHQDVLKLVEDIVRLQVLELIIQARKLSQRRATRTLSPEDLIFLIRYDRAKVNRLKTYLSWKDVRKNAKESEGDGGANAAEEEGADPVPKSKAKKIRLPWEIGTMFTEHLVNSAAPGDEDDELDEEDAEALEDSLQRLRDADEATRRMTREEYVHYSECRQASFTFRKSKKFREFINVGAYLDVKPNDDIIDILGFLAFEVVRELCIGAVAIKTELERQTAEARRAAQGRAPVSAVAGPSGSIAATATNNNSTEDLLGTVAAAAAADESTSTARDGTSPSAERRSQSPRKRAGGPFEGASQPPAKQARLSTSPSTATLALPSSSNAAKAVVHTEEEACGLFTMPLPKEAPLTPAHIQEAFARLQRKRPALGVGVGGAPGGLRRTRATIM